VNLQMFARFQHWRLPARLSVACLSLCVLCVLCVSVVNNTHAALTTEAQRMHRVVAMLTLSPQGPDLDYANFKHSSQRHASLACTSCHQRKDNSATPSFPGHKACLSCHSGQFVTPNVPMCVICHTDVNNANPPLRSFPAKFNESFNARFDHAQHMTGAARPANGCTACHGRAGARGTAQSIPAGQGAHNQTPLPLGSACPAVASISTSNSCRHTSACR